MRRDVQEQSFLIHSVASALHRAEKKTKSGVKGKEAGSNLNVL